MKKIFLIILSVALAGCLSAQESASSPQSLDDINRIKRDADTYLFAETTMASEDEAKNLARDFLVQYVRQWEKREGNEGRFDVDSLDSAVEYITVMRGPLFRVLAYVPKAFISGEPLPSAAVAPELDTAAVAPELDTAAVAPELDTAAVAPVAVDSEEETVYDKIIPKLMTVSSHKEAVTILDFCKSLSLCDFGEISAKTNPKTIAEGLLLIYSKETGDVKALLGPKNPGRLNLKTLEADSTANYPKCGAIWIIIK